MNKLLVTGSSGLIGSEVCIHFANLGWKVHEIDNNQRAVFFEPYKDTRWNQVWLQEVIKNFNHHELDIGDREGVIKLIKNISPNAIVHTAAQPSHNKAAAIPFDDFDTNAVGTFNLLEATRQYSLEVPFVHMSTNKVYGDAPNEITMQELDKRYDYLDINFEHGISENFRIDQTKHSLFGASKVSADISVQEYGSIEAFEIISEISGKKMHYKYDENNHIGDHICYYSDLRKMKNHYPNWSITKSLQTTFEEIYQAWN